MASFELTQVKRENHPFHSNIFPFFGAGNSAPAVQANSLHAADGGQQMFPCSGHLANYAGTGPSNLYEVLQAAGVSEAQVAREDITQKSTKTIPLRLERAVTQYGDFQFA